MKRKSGFVLGGAAVVFLVVTAMIIFINFNKMDTNEETVENSLIYFHDLKTGELIFYENGEKLDYKIVGKGVSAYTVYIGNKKDAFIARAGKTIKIIKQNGEEEIFAEGEPGRVMSFNCTNTQFLYMITGNGDISQSYIYDNGKNVELTDYRVTYVGQTSDRDYEAVIDCFWDGTEIYNGTEESILPGYYCLYDYKNYNGSLAYFDKNEKMYMIIDKKIIYGVSVNHNGKHIYYGDGEDRSIHCKLENNNVLLAERGYDIENFMDEGTYILADYDMESSMGILYYCNDGKNIQYVMDDVAYIRAEGPHVYIMVRKDGNEYDVYYGNPAIGYNKIEENVYYESKGKVF